MTVTKVMVQKTFLIDMPISLGRATRSLLSEMSTGWQTEQAGAGCIIGRPKRDA